MFDFRRSTILETTKDLLSENPALTAFEDVPKSPGQEHYFFLAALSTQLTNKTIIELGTHTGNSAHVLAPTGHIKNTVHFLRFDS